MKGEERSHPYCGGTNEFVKLMFILGYISRQEMMDEKLQSHTGTWLHMYKMDDHDDCFVSIYYASDMMRDMRECLFQYGIEIRPTEPHYDNYVRADGWAADDSSLNRAAYVAGGEAMFAPAATAEEEV